MPTTAAARPAPTTTVDLVVPDPLEDYTDCEAVDYTVIEHGDHAGFETIDVTVPGQRTVYARVTALDLVQSIDGIRLLLDTIESAVLDGRQQRREDAMVACPWCPTLIDPDEHTCGAASCERLHARECLDDMHTALEREQAQR